MPILLDALPYEDCLRAELSSPEVTAYAAFFEDELVGAAAVRWGGISEISLLGVVPEKRGGGHGTAIVAEIIAEARRRKVHTLLVATASFSVDNIVFYQKCGFRMSHVRRDFFATAFPEMEAPVWRGITLRDMIVLDYDLQGRSKT